MIDRDNLAARLKIEITTIHIEMLTFGRNCLRVLFNYKTTPTAWAAKRKDANFPLGCHSP